MSKDKENQADEARSRFNEWRDRLAVLMGVGPQRKEEIYLQIAQSASLRDVTYWLQILFSAGIATLGLAASSSAHDGMTIARGGGLLFLTNLAAITFTAMIVFLALHIDTESVRKRVREWRAKDQESNVVRSFMKRLPAFDRLRVIGSLPIRLLLILIVILLLLVPLSRSFTALRREIAKKNQENRVRQVAAEVWEQDYARLPDGSPRSYLGPLSILNHEGDRLSLVLRVFTSRPLTDEEKRAYTGSLASYLGRPAQSIALQLIEIPTATSDLLTRAKQEPEQEIHPEIVLTLPQLREKYSETAEATLSGINLPQPAELVNYEMTTDANLPLRVRLLYLSDREIEMDAQNLIVMDVRERLDAPDAPVVLERIETSFGPLTFVRNQSKLTEESMRALDKLGAILQQQPRLQVLMTINAEMREPESIIDERVQALSTYLSSKYQISTDRISARAGAEQRPNVSLIVSLRPVA